MRGTARGRWAVVGTVVALVAVSSPQALAEWDPRLLRGVELGQRYQCGDKDLPEGPIQGHVPKADQESRRAEQGYNCGLAVVGHTALTQGGRAGDNANMAWAGRCAYVASFDGTAVIPQTTPRPSPGSGVAVVSVSPDGTPRHVANLRRPGGILSAEAVHAVTTPEGRSILVVGQYGNDVVSAPKPMDVYDVSDPDCRKYKHMGTYMWPANIHNLTISADGRTVFATQPLQAADISGLWDADPRTGVRYLGNLQEAFAGPFVATGPMADLDDLLPAEVRNLTHTGTASHEAWPSADGKTLYVGGVTAEFEVFTIVDISQWLRRDRAGNPAGPPRIISQESGRGHSVRTATIDGEPYVLRSEESVFGLGFGCVPEIANPFAGAAQPYLANIADPTNPRNVAQFGLEINDPVNCLAQVAAGENNSVHYHDVDDPTDTTFVMASMWNSGLRIFDVRDPEQPTEVAYFNPGDIDGSPATLLDHAWGHVRYDAATGQIWMATAYGGFWVLRLEGKLRDHLGLDDANVQKGLPALNVPTDDPGRAGTRGVRTTLPALGLVDLAPMTCTLGSVLSPVSTVLR